MEDYKKSMAGLNIPLRPTGFEININAKWSAETVAKLVAKCAMKPEISTIAESALDFVSLRVKRMVDTGPGNGHPLSYVTSYHNELFGKHF